MSTSGRRQRSELHRELEPNILPRHMRALERVADRLETERPRPDPDFRAALAERFGALAASAGETSTAPWRAPAAAAVALGLVLLVAAAALAL
jgi:hypothetical protein